MGRTVLARGRAACACALVAAGIAGCAAGGNSSVTVSAKTLTIYLSDAQTDQPTVAADVLDAERLAFAKNGSRVDGFTIRLVTLHGTSISAEARTAIQDSTSAIAYLGEIVPHSSYASIGITNAVDLLQVSPTDTALELTQSSPAVPGSPGIYYESASSYGRTFARVVPTSAQEAKAQIQEMEALGVTKLYVADDGDPYGAAMAYALKHDLGGSISLSSTEAGADGVFYGTNSVAAGVHFFDSAASANPSAKLFGPSALDDPSFAAALSSSVHNLYVSSPGFLKQDLTPAGSAFVSAFTTAYNHAPAVQAIFGYEAMAAVLTVIKEAGSDVTDRSTVVKDFLSIKNRQSVLGTYSINANGDTSLAPFVFSRLAAGKLVPAKFVQVQG